MAVARRLIERKSTARSANVVSDPAAVALAFEVGVGGSATFAIGGHADSTAVRIKAVGYVRSLHDGEFRQELVGHGGRVSQLGRSAVLRFGALDVLVCHTIVAPGDPQIYRAFGIEPLMYDLVVVKANTSFRVGYANIAGEVYEADTPGVAAADLLRLSFRKHSGGSIPGRTTQPSRRVPVSGGPRQYPCLSNRRSIGSDSSVEHLIGRGYAVDAERQRGKRRPR